jgi:hypothetical protein
MYFYLKTKIFNIIVSINTIKILNTKKINYISELLILLLYFLNIL